LTERVLALSEHFASLVPPGDTADELRVVSDKLREPLRVAVAGRLKAGKSTLVNALLRQRVASVAVGECTKAVTWFTWGHQETVEVRSRDGASWSLGLSTDGRLPERLGDEPRNVERVTVQLSNQTLRSLTIIDTPGLDSLDAESSAATEELLALGRSSRQAVAEADALILLLPHLSRREAQHLEDFQAVFAGTGLSSASTIGVLSKADKVGDDDDPLAAARQLADRYQERLGKLVSQVVPVVGLLAETADADAFTEGDAQDLRSLAQVGPDRWQDFLLSADRFLDDDSLPVPAARRERLLELLDLFGLQHCLELISAGYTDTSVLVDRLRTTSGIGALRDALTNQFARRAEVLKAHAALSDLERISYRDELTEEVAVLTKLRDEIERLRSSPEMHQLRELEAARAWSSGDLKLAPELGAELERVASETTPHAKLGLPPDAPAAECRARALDRAGTWLALENDARTDPSTARAASTIQESYVILWEHFDVDG
jgi:hypothetical protein